jgi:y4mF family transcriptional regulator
MFLRTPSDIGAFIRERRKNLKLNQAALAKRLGVSRQWIAQLERGHARAELGLVLRTIDELGIELDARVRDFRRERPGAIDIDAIAANAKTKR